MNNLLKKVEKNKKLPRTKLDPAKVKFLTKDQVRKIIDPNDLDGDISDDFVRKLRSNINAALEWLKPRNARSPTTDIEDIRLLLKKLSKKLTPENIEFISGMSAARKRAFRPRDGSMTDPVAIETLKQFAATNAEISEWLEDQKARSLVLSSLRPELPEQTVVGHLLPNTFELSFFKKFGSGETGPGPRFVVAVMREAGLLHHNDKTTATYVREARRRMLTPLLSAGGDLPLPISSG